MPVDRKVKYMSKKASPFYKIVTILPLRLDPFLPQETLEDKYIRFDMDGKKTVVGTKAVKCLSLERLNIKNQISELMSRFAGYF